MYTLKDSKDVFIGRIIYGILFVIVLLFVWKTDIIRSRKEGYNERGYSITN